MNASPPPAPSALDLLIHEIQEKKFQIVIQGLNPSHLLLGPTAAKLLRDFLFAHSATPPITGLNGGSYLGLKIIETMEERVSVAFIP